ncbi:hypothetical protein [Streptomyces sp. MMG1533]|uniref:hypothetical protein n=1 Tax=Streptomyces sp. MMG1533 TaxID=1415546 RepID=UPI00131E64DC|nr:hypothetical protein [Streptomyces sp. MMG1533]
MGERRPSTAIGACHDGTPPHPPHRRHRAAASTVTTLGEHLGGRLDRLCRVARVPDPVGAYGASLREGAGRAVAPLWLRHQARAAAILGDPDRCEEARAALEPYRGLWLVSLLGWDISGPAELWTGIVDAAQERWDAAIGEFTEARRTADRLHARPWSVRARVELGAARLARDAPGDRDTAAPLLRDAESEARRLGMTHLAQRARRSAPAVTPPPVRRPSRRARRVHPHRHRVAPAVRGARRPCAGRQRAA